MTDNTLYYLFFNIYCIVSGPDSDLICTKLMLVKLN